MTALSYCDRAESDDPHLSSHYLHNLALYDAWHRDLAARIARATLIFTLVDADIDIDALTAELTLLKRTKTILDWLEKHDATQEECVS